MDLAIVNASKLVSDKDAERIAQVVDAQLKADVLPAWRRTSASCFFSHTAPNSPGILPITLYDEPDADSVGAEGWHNEDPNGMIYGRVFVGPLLRAGGGIFDGGSIGDSVSCVVSHEAVEAKGNPNVNLWARSRLTAKGKTYFGVAMELCDPVQAGGYQKDGALVSNFVTPAFFDPFNLAGPWDWVGVLKAPLSMADGGYMILDDGRNEVQVFASRNPFPWRASNRPAAIIMGRA